MVEDVGFRPRRLIYAHPPPRAEAAREAEAARQAAVEKVRFLGVVVVSLDAHFFTCFEEAVGLRWFGASRCRIAGWW